ncbi:MAG: hypothetical protein ISR58_05285 [Anaerolineales bacterium]|nr:hypothetical protein [Chloroflexota bacterium]MBL6980587.1 hypothetical protein [Anaerolineales bacterium]
MDEMEIIQPEDNMEISEEIEAPSEEEQSLEEATYEAEAHVEQSGNFEQSEAVETAMTDVIDSIIEEPAQESVEEPKMTQDVDPVTGQSKPSDGGTEEGGSDMSGADEEPSLVVDEDQSENEAPAGSAVDESEDQPGGDTEADVASDAAKARREGEEYADDKDTAMVTDDTAEPGIATVEKPAELVEDEVLDTGQIDQPQIERQLPQDEILAAGMAKHGLIPGEEQGKAGAAGAEGEGYPGLGKGTSGGGPPMMGKSGKSETEGKGYHSGKSETGRWLDKKAMENEDGVVVEPDGQGFWEQDGDGDWHYVEYQHDDEDPPDAGTPPEPGGVYGLTPDGDTPMPYTGSFGDGDGLPPDTSHKPPEGPDREASFLRMVASGKTDTKSYYGYGSSGSATFSPSGGGDTDDSGKYYGGLFGGGSIQDINPDDFDYYTPNVLAEALEKIQNR